MTIDVPDTMTTVAVLLSLTSGAMASTLGVRPPPRMATLSETISPGYPLNCRACVVPDDQFDLSAGDHVTVLRQMSLAPAGLFSDRAQNPGSGMTSPP